MTVGVGGPIGARTWSGLSTDTKSVGAQDDLFYETDTGRYYVWNQGAWTLMSNLGRTTVDNHPQTQSQSSSGTGVNDNDILFTIQSEFWREYQFQVTAGIADVDVTLDGVNWTGPVPILNSLGLAALASDELNVAATATAFGRLYGCFPGVRVRQKGATAATVRYTVGA